MIDLHCHILPGIDDGASSETESIAMLQAAIDEGVTTIAATPHHNRQYTNEKQAILHKVEELRQLIKENNLAIEVVPGQEVRIYGELLEDYENNKLVTISEHSRYMLIEFSSSHVPRYAERLLYDMELQGLKPVIVHPERNAEIMQNPDKLYQLVEKGALTQVTAASVTGHFGKKIQKFTSQLIEADLAHIIASDAHNTAGRTFRMRQAFAEIETHYGMDYVDYFQENAKLILDNKAVYPEQPKQIIKKKFLGIF